MSYRCEKGCKRYHVRRSDCPYEESYAGRKPEPSPVPVREPLPDSRVVSPETPALRTAQLILGSKEGGFAEVQSRTAAVPTKPEVTQDWILSPEYAKRAWVLFYGGWEFGLNQIGKFYDYAKKVDHSIFEFSESQQTNFGVPSQYSFMCRIPTYVLKQMGCKTLQEAQDLIEDVEFLTFLGKPIVGSVDYLYSVYEESPKLRKAREAAKAAEEAKRRAINTTGQEIPPPPMAASST